MRFKPYQTFWNFFIFCIFEKTGKAQKFSEIAEMIGEIGRPLLSRPNFCKNGNTGEEIILATTKTFFKNRKSQKK